MERETPPKNLAGVGQDGEYYRARFDSDLRRLTLGTPLAGSQSTALGFLRTRDNRQR